MRNNKGFVGMGIILAIITVLIVGGGAYYLGTKNNIVNNPVLQNTEENLPAENQNQNVTNQTSTEDQTFKKSSSSSNTNCIYNSKYFVIDRADPLSAGDDILIKYKTEKNQNISCEYVVSKTDFEIKNSCNDGPVCYRAQYSSNLKNNLLIVDQGTGTENRGIIIYDLIKKSEVFKDTYSSGDLLYPDNNTISYWINTKETANKENCPKIDEYEKQGGGAKLETKVSLDLSNFTKTNLGESRCSYSQ